MTKLDELAQLGQSVWLDYIRRSFITSGELQTWINQGLRGITSNPTIFEKAIVGSDDYGEQLRQLVGEGKSVEEIYRSLAIDDIQRAADLLHPIYDKTGGVDGYVSLEVNPKLAHDTQGTIAEARELFAAVGRPNLMIKVPATPEGIPAIETLIGEGRNINVTLIFSLDQYQAVAEAYLSGLEKLAASGQTASLQRVASVASYFVSRIDSLADRELESLGEAGQALRGKIAIASAQAAYARFCEITGSDRWQRLAGQGARVQRLLWGSTSAKNPAYSDTLYVDNLIGPHTVNTMPLPTVQAFLDHGRVAVTLHPQAEEALAELERLSELGVDLDDITDRLLADGVRAFSDSFESLMEGIARKRDELSAANVPMPAPMMGGGQPIAASLGVYQAAVDAAVAEMSRNQVVSRIWQRDHTLWKPEPTEITNRLGWLDSPQAIQNDLPHLQALAEQVWSEGYTDALLLGMGGSSLAPELFQGVFGATGSGLTLSVLDSTVPEAVLDYAERLDPAHTLFIVSSKSGTTVETLSFFKFFYNQVVDAVGKQEAGQHFISITDEGTYLAKLAKQYNFRASFLNDPNLGGRYSALSFFGLVPAALVGVELPRLLERALAIAHAGQVAGEENAAVQLGAILGELAKQGRDKATFIVSSTIGNLADWIEQLIAESTGKEGRGILPVVKEPFGLPEAYGADRLFVYIRRDEQPEHDQDNLVQAYEDAGFPVVRLHVQDAYDMGGQFLLWELATAIAGHRLGINPFDQPDVEAAKARAREMVKRYTEMGSLPHEGPSLVDGGIAVYGRWPQAGGAEAVPGAGAGQALKAFLSQGQPGDYVALQAYVQPTVLVEAALRSLAARIRNETRLATTVGYGPRYLHSTGQLHKGDAGRGLFIQFTDYDLRDAPIPDEAGSPQASLTFGVLKTAQALGDRQALLDAGRRVIRFHLGTAALEDLNRLVEALAPRAATPAA